MAGRNGDRTKGRSGKNFPFFALTLAFAFSRVSSCAETRSNTAKHAKTRLITLCAFFTEKAARSGPGVPQKIMAGLQKRLKQAMETRQLNPANFTVDDWRGWGIVRVEYRVLLNLFQRASRRARFCRLFYSPHRGKRRYERGFLSCLGILGARKGHQP